MTDWHEVRALIRRAILLGDVVLSGHGLDGYRTRSRAGLDSDIRLTFCDAVYAIRRLPEADRRLVVADIGRPCNSSHTSLSPKVTARYAPLTEALSPEPLLHWHSTGPVDRERLAEVVKVIVARVRVEA